MTTFSFFVAVALVASSSVALAEIHGVTFSAIFSTNDNTNMCLDEPTLRRNLAIAGSVSPRIRLYSTAQCPQNTRIVLEYAREAGKRIMLGLWISRDTFANNNEFFWLNKYAVEFQDVLDAVIVGNEAVAVQKVPLPDLLSAVARTRKQLAAANVQIPVTTAVIWPVLEEAGGQIAAVSDFICMHVQPYWEGRPARCPPGAANCVSAGRYAVAKAAEIEALLKKPVQICETGWPTEGEKCCDKTRPHVPFGEFKAVPSLENAKIFLDDLAAAAKADGRAYYYHEAIDGDWKRNWSPCGECLGVAKDAPIGCGIGKTCELDYHYGLFTSNAVPKLKVP